MAVEPTNSLDAHMPPNRGTMIAIDLDSSIPTELPRAMEFFFNPVEVGLTANAVWAKLAIPGLSHEVLQYSHSESVPVTMSLQWSALEAIRRRRAGRAAVGRGEDPNNRPVENPFSDLNHHAHEAFMYRDFLYSFSVPMSPGRSPSRCMIIWPNFLSIITVMSPIAFNFTQFAKSGWPMAFTASITLTEHRVVFRQREGRKRFFTQVDQKLTGQEQGLQQAAELQELSQDILLDF